ncbi:MAG: ribosome-binding factor A [bacterium]
MSDTRHDKLISALIATAAEFFNLHSSKFSMITITGCELSRDGREATFLISVYPTDKEDAAIDFAKRNRSELREYLMTHIKSRSIPRVDVIIDEGEKNRQRIDELLNQAEKNKKTE